MNLVSKYSKIAIEILEEQITRRGFTPFVHFELEGSYTPSTGHKTESPPELDYAAINRALERTTIQGRLKPEYWLHQWEFVTTFEGQPPHKTAEDLQQAMDLLPRLLPEYGTGEVLIKPVVWGGDQRRLARGSQTIFCETKKTVHIPNAIQINISAFDRNGNNVLPVDGIGERLQNRLLETSYECCLLYLPEAEAFDRLGLPEKYGLDNELSSPTDLSGGHQGSVALYKNRGKHNQKLGITPLLVDSRNQTLSSTRNWRPLSRIEHRLGASSKRFNPYVNTVFVLANLLEALCVHDDTRPIRSPVSINETHMPTLPDCLFQQANRNGAYEVFERGSWFENTINQMTNEIKTSGCGSVPKRLGSLIKQAVLESYGKRVVSA